MKLNVTIVLLSLLPMLSIGQVEEDTHALESFIEIKGHSNINSFELSTQWEDPSEYTAVTNQGQFQFVVPLREFKTKKKVIYKDFLEMVKSETYPDLKITFSTNSIDKPLINSLECTISLAGVSNQYTIPVYCFQIGENSYYIKGSNTIALGSFEIEPPKKLLNLVKVKEDIDVDFALVVEGHQIKTSSSGF